MIIDVVEPLYHTMMSQYGKVLDPADVLLVMEVAQTEEDHTLLEVMLRTIYEKVRRHNVLQGAEAWGQRRARARVGRSRPRGRSSNVSFDVSTAVKHHFFQCATLHLTSHLISHGRTRLSACSDSSPRIPSIPWMPYAPSPTSRLTPTATRALPTCIWD